jgi:fatty acid desaturase
MQLASDPQTSIPWHQLYLGLAGVSLLLLISLWMGLYPFELLTGVQYALLVIAAFWLTAMAHTYDLRRWRRRADDAAPDFILELND